MNNIFTYTTSAGVTHTILMDFVRTIVPFETPSEKKQLRIYGCEPYGGDLSDNILLGIISHPQDIIRFYLEYNEYNDFCEKKRRK